MEEQARSSRRSVILPTLPSPAPLAQAVLFAFDNWAFPFTNHTQVHLIPGNPVARRPKLVLDHGPEGAHDEALRYYGSVIRIDDVFHMWYKGGYGPPGSDTGFTRSGHCTCYATSKDGVHWDKPALDLVEYRGSKQNNIIPFPQDATALAVLYEPDDPNPHRRFKAAYEGTRAQFSVAFSPDGLHWEPFAGNPVGPFLEMAGITKFRGLYYVNGQTWLDIQRPIEARRLETFASVDFEHWSPCSAMGLERSPDVAGPSTVTGWNQYEEVHLGAAMWNRGNVILGIYGQWHGHPTGDRRLLTMDLGLALSHDAIHFYEPIPDFKFILAREQPGSPSGVGPALMQGQGMENVGDRTLYWYSLWSGLEGNGVRMVSWERDRLGMLQPFQPLRGRPEARTVSCPVQVLPEGQAAVHVNASGLGEHSRLRIELLDEGFRPVPHYSGPDAALISEEGLRTRVRWPGGDVLLPSHGRVRLAVHFDGVRPEDCRLHAVYVDSEG